MKRSSWIDKFLTSDKMTKLAMQVESNYVKQLQRLKDEVTATQKWSSIEEALDDFATRNGISRKELRYLQKAAGLAPAQQETSAEKLIEEGIGSQGAEFMAKSKKHSEPGKGPFVVTNPQSAKQIREKARSLKDAFDENAHPQTNEMNAMDTTAYWTMQFKKYAQEFGKILDMPSVGTEEGMKKLVEELSPSDFKSTYNLVRHGFKFTNVHGEGFTKKDEPVKVTVYKYSFLKTNIANAINQSLRQQLAQELPIDQWIAFLETKGGSQARDIKMQLQKLQRDLFSDKPGFVETELDRAKPQTINRILQFFPRSYQRVILSMLAEGEYRHLTGEAGRKHSEIFSSGHALGSFILMESFDPYIKIVPQLKTKEEKQALVSALSASEKDTYSHSEFADLLDRTGIAYQDMPVTKEFQTLKMADKSIRIDNDTNSSYRPVTNKLSPQDLTDPEAVEEQLKSFQDRLASIIMQDSDRIEKAKAEGRPIPNLTPLAYEKQSDGSYVPVDLKTLGTRDLTKTKLSYEDPSTKEKTYIDNPTAGIHPSFKGSLEGLQTQEPFFSGTNVSRWKSKPQTGTPTVSTPAPEPTVEQKKEKEDRWERFKNKAKDLKKFQALTRAMIRLGAADLWIDDKGRIYPSQDQMEKTLFEECADEAASDIIEKATDSLESFVDQMPTDNVVPFKSKDLKPEETLEEPEEEEDRLPLAAKSVERLKKIAHKSKRLQQLLKE